MLVQVTVALGKNHFKDNQVEKLKEVISSLSPTVDEELPYMDKAGKWSYTFAIEVKRVDTLKKRLHKEGRYKIIKIVDVDSHSLVYQSAHQV